MSTPHTRVKICGVTTVANALLAAHLGADAVGLNFCLQSRRFVHAAVAQEIVAALPPFVDPVALFVNEPLERAGLFVWQLRRVRTLQWHGDEPALPLADAWWWYVPAFPIADAAGLARVTAYLDRCRAAGRLPAAVLLDGHAPGQYGGTGRTAPWHLLAGFDPGVPVILAGGLTPENVAEAIRTVRPYAVDVAGGVESAPGRKDPDKLQRFLAAVREARDSGGPG